VSTSVDLLVSLDVLEIGVTGSNGDEIRLLCVDDDRPFLDMTAAYLEHDGRFSVHTETDTEAALSVLGDRPIDAVVSDYQMPEMDGLTFLERVRESDPDLPFILFTGKGSESIASSAITAGVTDYLQKRGPEQYDLLANRVANAVESVRSRREVERERRIREWILEATPVGIVGHDAAGDVIFLNDRATEILAAPTDELDGRAYPEASWELLTEVGDPVTGPDLPYRRVVDAASRLEGERYLLRTAGGTEQGLVVYGSPLWGEDGTVEGAVIAFYLDDEI
jgi:CheY-like chemotaxis protein